MGEKDGRRKPKRGELICLTPGRTFYLEQLRNSGGGGPGDFEPRTRCGARSGAVSAPTGDFRLNQKQIGNGVGEISEREWKKGF